MKKHNFGSHGRVSLILALALIVPILLIAGAVILVSANSAGGEVLTQELFEPLGDVTTAKIAIDAGDGNLSIDTLTGGEPALAGGTLQYTEKQGEPERTLVTFGEQADLTLAASGGPQPWLNLPWAACNGATEWLVHLNPDVQSAITAHSNGGNIMLNLASMALTSLSVDTGGGNIELTLPDAAANLSVEASTGAGNVTVSLPSGLAARIHATSGLGKVIVDAGFDKIDDSTYQTPGYESAPNHVEITLESGAGNVIISTK